MNNDSPVPLTFTLARRFVFWKSLVAGLALWLTGACGGNAAEMPVPSYVAGMERAWRQRCNDAVDQLKPAYLKSLKLLQKKAIVEENFAAAKEIQARIESLPQQKIADPAHILCPGITSRVWTDGSNKRRISPDGYHWRSSGNGPFQNQGQKMRSSAYGKDVLVFGDRNAPQLIWLLLDEKRILELFWNDHFRIYTPDMKVSAYLDDLAARFDEQCFRACEALTQKYVAALGEVQKTLARKGDMEGAMQVYAYLQTFSAGGILIGKTPKELCGVWKEHLRWKYGIGATGCKLVISDTGRGECVRSDGSVLYRIKYVSSSPWKGFHHFSVVAPGQQAHGYQLVVFRIDDRLYIVRPDDSRHVRELHPQ